MAQSKFLALILQDSWNIETFIGYLDEAARKRTALVFYGELARKLTDSLSLVAIFQWRDPRADILNFVMSSPAFNKVEAAYYQQIFKPVLEEMMTGEPNCIHHIGSSGFVKNIFMKAVLSRFNVEPYFIHFAQDFQNAIESRL